MILSRRLSFILLSYNQNLRMSQMREGSPYFLRSQSKSSKHIIYTEKSLDRKDKLHEKIKKLKHQLKIKQKHNMELHHALKKSQEEVKWFRGEESRVKSMVEQEKVKLQLEIHELKLKLDFMGRTQLQTKQLQKHKREQEQNNLHQLEDSIKILKKTIHEKDLTIQEMTKQLSGLKSKMNDERDHHVRKIEKDLQRKTVQSEELRRQVIKLKQSIKELMGKAQKNNIILQQKVKQNRKNQHKEKQMKILTQILQKENKVLKEQQTKTQTQLIKSMEKNNEIEKQIIQFQYEKKDIQAKLSHQKGQNQQLKQELAKSILSYEQLHEKHQQSLCFNYEIQKDMERQLHTIAKELARRHIVSQSMASSTICQSPFATKHKNAFQ